MTVAAVPDSVIAEHESKYTGIAYKIIRTEQIVDELIRNSKGNVPDEILGLIARILIDENATRVPAVHYRRSSKWGSTGRCYNDHIVLSIGRWEAERLSKWIVIHEMSHWIAAGEHHSPFFYEQAFELYERYGCDMDAVRLWEIEYKSSNARMGYALYMRSCKGTRWTYKAEDC